MILPVRTGHTGPVAPAWHRNLLHPLPPIADGMKRYLPVLVLLALLLMVIGSAGCTSASSRAKTTTETTLGPTMTKPAVPVFTTPAFGGSAATGSPAARGPAALNTSRSTPADPCPASRPFRCADGYCTVSGEECPLHAQAVNCSSGTVYCP